MSAPSGTNAPDPLVVAMVAAALDQVWPRPVASPPDKPDAAHLAWRFSGRWWSRPALIRRARPWTA
ncbi:MAG: hypothetical protein M0Z95_06155 [Actinomycetota bacterium]|nr:hypothetical protein [Actinomycetota bacterium]